MRVESQASILLDSFVGGGVRTIAYAGLSFARIEIVPIQNRVEG